MADKEAKKKGSRIKRLFKRLLNVRYWFDFDRVKDISRYFIATFKKFFVPSKQEASESFSQAMARLQLTEADILMRQSALLRLVYLMLMFAGLAFAYACYLLWQHAWHSGGFTFVVLGLALTLAFRYHFWYFQIKQRKLGCSFQEWFHQGLLGRKS